MQTAIRAGIMLTVLVGLPAAWVYYGPLPKDAQRVVDRFVGAAKEAIGWEKLTAPPGETEIAAGAAPSFTPASSLATAPPVPAPVSAEPQPRPLADRVAHLLDQLQRRGVVAYALEPWGADGRLFRFHCEMPLADSEQATEQFEAIAADPQESIANVVAEVASWQSSRLANTMQ